LSRKEKFYRPEKIPDISVSDRGTIIRVQGIHEQLNHASSHEMIRVITANPRSFNTEAMEIKVWKEKMGQYCLGCIEGAMKQHSKLKSSKPLTSQMPGEINRRSNVHQDRA
jgi:hypothetical protein